MQELVCPPSWWLQGQQMEAGKLEMESRKNCFPGCKAEMCRNEVTWQRPLGTKARFMFSKLQSHYFIETHPSCSLYPTVLVPWGASTTLGEAVGVSPDGICLESAMTGRSSQCSLIFQLGISKARRESSKLCWMFSTQSPLVELTGSAGSLFPSVSESHLRNICFSSQTITNIQSCISAALNEGITP